MTTEKQIPEPTAYEVQTYTLFYGWLNIWTYDDPQGVTRIETFPTKDAAQAALDENLEELAEEYEAGNISEYTSSDFRVAQCLPGTANAMAGAL
jgi:hypothetical protein